MNIKIPICRKSQQALEKIVQKSGLGAAQVASKGLALYGSSFKTVQRGDLVEVCETQGNQSLSGRMDLLETGLGRELFPRYADYSGKAKPFHFSSFSFLTEGSPPCAYLNWQFPTSASAGLLRLVELAAGGVPRSLLERAVTYYDAIFELYFRKGYLRYHESGRERKIKAEAISPLFSPRDPSPVISLDKYRQLYHR